MKNKVQIRVYLCRASNADDSRGPYHTHTSTLITVRLGTPDSVSAVAVITPWPKKLRPLLRPDQSRQPSPPPRGRHNDHKMRKYDGDA